jgi:tRNA-Thr(GGU) m(6)t(6)A37 methyltransferase TsaA
VILEPIGVVRTPFSDKASAPRQPSAAHDAPGRVELAPGRGLEHALRGIDAWRYVWILYTFHLNEGHWRPTVLPPRSRTKRGVLATRSPHRPNGIGMSAVRLERVEPLVLHVRGVDMVDGSPVLDVKPYVAYADAIPDAAGGWLDAPDDPGPRFEVVWSERALAQRTFLGDEGADLASRVDTILAVGPEPHPYRRIRAEPGGALRVAVKAWRCRFRVEGASVVVLDILSGYRPRELATREGEEIELHRAFVARFAE